MQNTFRVTIGTGNAAFDDDSNGRDEVARILRSIATSLEDGTEGGAIFDINGNRVGAWEHWHESEDDEGEGD